MSLAKPLFLPGALALAAALLGAPEARAAGAKGPHVEPPSHDPAAHHLKLEILPISTPVGPWRLRIENAGSVPVRLIADARLVTMEVEATAQEEDDADDEPTTKRRAKRPKKKGPLVVHCRLPPEMRPTDDDDARALVLPPGRAYAETFDVRALCFGNALDTFVPGAKVTAHFGWSGSTKKNAHTRAATLDGPAVISPLDLPVPTSSTASAEPVARVAELDAPPVTLAAPPALDGMLHSPMPAPTADEDRDGDGIADDAAAPKLDPHRHLVLSLPRFVDHESRVDIPAPITLKNMGDRPRTIFFQASRVRFDVITPVGERIPCGSPPDQTPMREFYTHLKHGQSAHLPMLVSDVCDVDVFTRAGVYEVYGHVDDIGLSGAQLGLNAFAGILNSKPMLVRVRRESRHYDVQRPRLE